MRRLSVLVAVVMLSLMSATAGGQSKREYQNRFRLMLDFAVRTNEYVRRQLGDRSLSLYSHAMAEKNATEAEKMTPPKPYALLHPHFLLVLENIERSFFFAARGEMGRYRHHQRIVRKELQLLEAMAERENLELYFWMRCL